MDDKALGFKKDKLQMVIKFHRKKSILTLFDDFRSMNFSEKYSKEALALLFLVSIRSSKLLGHFSRLEILDNVHSR